MMEVTASVLAGQRVLHGLRAGQLDALAATASEVTFPAGQRIFAAGGPVASFWLIESGYAALDVPVPGERPVIIGTVGIGGLLGWSWLLPPYQWAFGAVCVTEVRAIEFGAPAVRDRCAADPELGYELTRRMFEVLAGRLQDTRDKLVARSLEENSLASSQRAEQLCQCGRTADAGCHVVTKGPHFGFSMPGVPGETQLPHRGAHGACPVADGNRLEDRAVQDVKVARDPCCALTP